MDDNPYQSPQTDCAPPASRLPLAAKFGRAILAIGLIALAYGVLTFWFFPSLPLSSRWSGRLPSIYAMGIGIFAALIGLTLNSLKGPSKTKPAIPSSVGILIIVALIIAFFVAVSRL
jgi:hypothetical protein